MTRRMLHHAVHRWTGQGRICAGNSLRNRILTEEWRRERSDEDIVEYRSYDVIQCGTKWRELAEKTTNGFDEDLLKDMVEKCSVRPDII